MSEPSRIDLGVLAKRQDNTPITREATCVCGKPFTQSILSERYLASLERMGKVDAVARQLPGFWLPKYCPPCERKDIALEARRVDVVFHRGAA
jgi:hypothetical protein